MKGRHRLRAVCAAVALAAFAAGGPAARAQAPAPPQPQAQAATSSPQAPPATKPPAGEAYSYNPEGRRDPFVSLLSRGSLELKPTSKRPEGLQGLLITEVSIRGIVKSRDTFVAVLQAPDNRTYLIRPNDRLLDGVVKAITADAVVFLQEVNDPLSLIKQREVRKPLRPLEEGKS